MELTDPPTQEAWDNRSVHVSEESSGMWRGSERAWLTQDQLERRASARRHYNSWRQFVATYRRCEVAKLLMHGWKPSHIAVRLNVSPSTIGRDMQRLMQEGRDVGRCPTCQRPYRIALPPGYEV